MKDNKCGMFLIYSYVSYVGCFCCMVLKECMQEQYKKWKNSSSTTGFNKYEIIPKSDDNIINIEERQISFEKEENTRTINLNQSTSTILKNWTMRPTVSESINEYNREPI